MNKNMLYRSIPKVDVLLEDEAIQAMIEHYSRRFFTPILDARRSVRSI